MRRSRTRCGGTAVRKIGGDGRAQIVHRPLQKLYPLEITNSVHDENDTTDPIHDENDTANSIHDDDNDSTENVAGTSGGETSTRGDESDVEIGTNNNDDSSAMTNNRNGSSVRRTTSSRSAAVIGEMKRRGEIGSD